jgi:nonsense-mediated mRNA decay protein 3
LGESIDLGGDFCVVCGAEPPLYHERMCEQCTRIRSTIAKVPQHIQYFQCASCHLYDVGGRWVEVSTDDLQEELLNRNLQVDESASGLVTKITAEVTDDRNTILHLELTASIHGLRFEEQHVVTLRRSNGVCLTCTRRAGNYYVATVQLRSAGRRLGDDELEELRTSLDEVIAGMSPDPMFFISSESEVQGGYDVILGSKGLARAWSRKLLRKWGGQCKETNSVVGHKDGADITRLTILYRRPGYDIGDVVRWRDILWRVSGWTGDGAVLARIEWIERCGASWRDMEKATVLCPLAEQYEVEMVTQDSSAGEFLNPDTWTPTTVRLPYDHSGGSTIRVAKVEGDWVALPNLSIDARDEG